MIDTPLNVPRRLYKYRSVSQGALSNTKKLVVNSEFYFPKAEQLNDPFELSPYLENDLSDDEKVRFVERVVDATNPNLDTVERKNLISRMVSKDPSKDAEVAFRKVMSNIGIFSMSSDEKSTLMWPHYGNDHRGICVIIDVDRFNDLEVPDGITDPYFSQVEYVERRPTYNPFRDDQMTMITATTLRKGRDWQYENEWRMLLIRDGGNAIKFPEGTVAGVIFGARISSHDKDEILSWKNLINHKIEFHQASFDERDYKIDINQIFI